jgi:glycosyltransferase involved in cell wall biosynthesis
MNTSTRTYWIDLSDLSEWSGHYTGIQRVVFNISKYYAERSDVRFFVFDRPQTGFFEVDFEIIKKPTESMTIETDGPIIRQHILRRIAYAIPGRYRQMIPSSAKELLKSVYRTTKNVRQNSKKQASRNKKFASNNKAIFSKNDVILVLGSPWANPVMMPSLVASKQEVGFKLVQLIYDVIPVLMPYLFGEELFAIFTRYLFDVVANSDALVAISKSSKHDVEKFMDDLLVPKVPVDVIRLGDEFDQSVGHRPGNLLQPNNFILCVGTFEVRKNHQLLYYAYKEAKLRGDSLPKLVIVGRQGWLTRDLEYVIKNDLDVKDDILIMHDTSDSGLAWLYSNCRFTVYPSLYEGWGLPISESLAYGKFCIASNTSSMIEIAPELVDHFSPYNPVECLDLLKKYSNDDKALRDKENLIKLEYKEYTWIETFTKLQTFIEDILG